MSLGWYCCFCFFFSSRRRHTRFDCDWSSTCALPICFPLVLLKIDQGFIRDIPHSADDMAISGSVIALGHAMGLKVLAEGVETAEQLAFLRGKIGRASWRERV